MRVVWCLALLLSLAPAAHADDAAVVVSAQRPFQVAATAAQKRLGANGHVVDAGALRRDPDLLNATRVVISVGPLASGSVAGALPPGAQVVAILTPRTMGLPPTRTLVIPLDPEPEDVFAVLKGVLPDLGRVGVLTGKSGPTRAALERAALKAGLEVVVGHDDVGIERALDTLLPAVEVLVVDRSAAVNGDPEGLKLLLARAEDAAVPVIGAKKSHVLLGAVFAVVPDPAEQGRVAGDVARRLLDGEQVTDVGSPKGAILWNPVVAHRHNARLPASLKARAENVR